MKNIFYLALIVLSLSCEKSSSSGNSATVVAPLAPISENPAETPTETVTQSWTEEFMTLINDHRKDLGLNPLILDQAMTAIVQTHSDNMASGAVAFGHTNFSARCSAARAALGGGNLCGENVASGQKTPSAAYTAWMNSSGHRANIEQSRYTHCGFAYQKSSSGTYYWTHLFLEN